MALQNGDILAVSFEINREDRRCFITRHYTVSAVVGTPTAQDAAIALHTHNHPPLRNALCSDTLVSTTWTERIQGAAGQENGQQNDPQAGTYPDLGTLPYQVAGLVRLTTATHRPRGEARCYMPFVPRGLNGPTAQPTPDAVGRLDAIGASLTTGIPFGTIPDTGFLTPVVYRRSDGSTLDLVAGSGSTQWASQRRRNQIWHGPGFHFPHT